MPNQKPIINKCCGIIPNRPCLVIFAVLKIIADILALGFFGFLSVIAVAFAKPSPLHISSALAVDLGFLLDVAFLIILIVAACTNCKHLYKLSFYYGIISLVVAVVSTAVVIVLSITTDVFDFYSRDIYNDPASLEYILIHIALIAAYALIHTLIILLIKSEVTRKTFNNDEDKRMKRNSQLSYGRFD